MVLSCPERHCLCLFPLDLLLTSLQVTTVKSILTDAGQKFGMNMKPRKPIISGTITQFLEATKAGQDPFVALGLETEQEAPNASDMRKVQGRVIVVGAGPAGLAAALHLKVRLMWCEQGCAREMWPAGPHNAAWNWWRRCPSRRASLVGGLALLVEIRA